MGNLAMPRPDAHIKSLAQEFPNFLSINLEKKYPQKDIVVVM